MRSSLGRALSFPLPPQTPHSSDGLGPPQMPLQSVLRPEKQMPSQPCGVRPKEGTAGVSKGTVCWGARTQPAPGQPLSQPEEQQK